MRTALAVIVGAALIVQQDAGRVLADMRQALGGDAAIAALHGFAVTSTQSLSVRG